ncbi:MAG TPA: urate hydroxylase PuuD [Bacteriovoracaceae bacterium]|nr:urate hydroxylase PuuD [Bacteriovoracaceae bacterium]
MDVALFTQEGLIMILRWIHFFAGVAWIGHLYYFNFVQGAFLAEVDAPVKNVTLAKLAPRALWWFRWGAMFTFLSGMAMLSIVGKDLAGDFFQTPYGIYIYTGSLMGLLMFLNVWLIIWPRQKVIVASALSVIGGGAANPEAAKLGPGALLASRTNVLFSIPLLFFMGASRHLSLSIPENFSPAAVLGVVTAVILLLELNAIKGKLGPMTTVKGVIHCGLALLVVLYGLIEAIV